MQVSVTTTSGLEREIKIEVPASEVQQAIEKRINQLSKEVKLDGFRPGKVPTSVIEKRYGDSVRHEVTEELMRESLFKAFEQESIQPAGQPTITELKADAEQPMTFTAKFEVFPEFELKDLSGQTIEKRVADISDKDIDETLEKLRSNFKDWVVVERAAAKGDQVTIDFAGTIEGEPLDGGTAEGFKLELGAGNMIPGFEDDIIGRSANDEFEINVTFPENYHHKPIAGKPAVFKIKLHEVSEAALPELDEKFAERFDIKEGGLAALKEQISKDMQRNLDQAVKAEVKRAVSDKLAELHSFEVPAGLIEGEVKQMIKQSQQGNANAPIDPALLKDEKIRASAEKRVKLGLIFNKLIEDLKLELDQARVRKAVEDIAANFNQSEEFVEHYLASKEVRSQVEPMVMEEQIIDKLLESATIKEKSVSYLEIMQPSELQDGDA